MSTVQQRNGQHREGRPSRGPALVPIEHMTHFGALKWFDPARGYGFIEADGGAQDVFLHKSVIHLYGLHPSDLFKGLRVGFCVTPQQPGKRPEASAIAIA